MGTLIENRLAYAGAFAALAVSCGAVSSQKAFVYPHRPVFRPLPHQVPKFLGGTSLRLAMVHDVLTQRYPTHSQAYHAACRDRARAALAAHEPIRTAPPWSVLDHFDDLALALHALGQPDQALDVLRRKASLLAQRGPRPEPELRFPPPDHLPKPTPLQLAYLRAEEVGMPSKSTHSERRQLARAHYHTDSNLARILTDSALDPTLPAADARARLSEAKTRSAHASAACPTALFARDLWRAHTIHIRRAFLDDPPLLRHLDLVGNDLDAYLQASPRPRSTADEGIPSRRRYRSPTDLDGLGHIGTIRRYITQVGAEHPRSSLPEPVAFDEPTLGILSMWLFDDGPDPHLALTLGQIMERVGQRHLAWTAFERATHMAERFSPDPDDQTWFVEHCRKHQQRLEDELQADPQDLRAAFDRDLADGEDYQRRYQQLEAERIAQGHDLEAVQRLLEQELGVPSTPPGSADWAWVASPVRRGWAWSLGALACLGAGIGAWVGAVLNLLSHFRRTARLVRTKS